MIHTLLTDDSIQIAYREDGPPGAPPLLFLNSLGTNMNMWDAQAKALQSQYRVIRYDTRGHGRSSVPRKPYGLDRLGQDALTLLDHLEIKQAHLCGLSMGGLTALWLAIHHPDRVRHAVFADTAARIGTSASWATRIEAIEAGGMKSVSNAVLARFLSAAFRAAQPAITRRIEAMLLATDPAGYVAACAAIRDADLHAELNTITAPSLILCGELDESTPVEQSRELQSVIKGSQLAVFPGVAHLSNIEQPETFTAHLMQFLGNSATKE